MKIKFKFNQRIKTKVADITLILHDNLLLYAEKNLEAKTFSDDSTALAEAARRLLTKISPKKRIALALPNAEFVATSLQLPTRAMDDIKATISLQRETLLPAGTKEQLLLAVQAPLEGDNVCALWMSAKRAEALWKAFDKQNLYLSCIFPRSVIVLSEKKTPYSLYDEDKNSITCLASSNGVIQQWLYISKPDYELPELKQQLDETLSNFNKNIKAERKNTINDWKILPSKVAYNYAFIPPSAVARLAKNHQFKKRLYGMSFVILLIASLIGGVFYAIDYEKALKQELADLRRSTHEVSELRVEVGQIEENLAAIKDFPKQEVVKILRILDKRIPKDTWITRFYIEEGIIKLEGYSLNPTRLIEILSQQSEFYDIEQSRGTVSEFNKKELKFGISFKLKDFNQNYWLTYFSKER